MMKDNSSNMFFRFFAMLSAILCLSGAAVYAQDKTDKPVKNNDFCSNYNYSNGDKVSYKETREVSLRAGSLLEVDGKRNGGVKVRGEDRADVLVRACVQTVGVTDEAARSVARNIRIETSPIVRAENSSDESNWAVSYEILVPRLTNLKLMTHNGGIGINGVEGTMEFEALNGGIHLSDVAGDVKGRTTNGGVHVDLSGNSWKGAGLNVETTNGGVHLSMPESYAAHFETRTVNGGFKSEISQLNIKMADRTRGVNINTNLNGGGAPIRVITTNGGVRISSAVKNL